MPSVPPDPPWVLAHHGVRGLYPLMSQLRQSGLAVRTVPDPARILSMAAQSPMPSAIILDIRMNEADGLSLCRTLRTNHATDHIPVFFLTAANDPIDRVNGLKAGAAEYIVYPCEPGEVLLRLRMHMAASGSAHPPVAAKASAQSSADGRAWSREQELVWAAQQYVAEDDAEMLTQHELARLMGTSEAALTAAFQRVLDVSAYEYLRVQRFKAAAALLRNSAMRISDIAERVGYTDSANFTTAFRGYAGMPPTAYRERSRRDALLNVAGTAETWCRDTRCRMQSWKTGDVHDAGGK